MMDLEILAKNLTNPLDNHPETRYNTHMNHDQITMLRDIFPEAQIEQDNDGQYIIYTGIFEDSSPAT